jgi:catechol 2,3-dioxygenase-like lactoylglutathione lyase family enzyme
MIASVDFATPNLPSRNFDDSEAFYAALGFETDYRAAGWMILSRSGLQLEFFPYPDLDPATSGFSCCLRLNDLDGFVTACGAAAIPVTRKGWPRLHLPERDVSGERIGYLIDPDGTLLRLIDENRAA